MMILISNRGKWCCCVNTNTNTDNLRTQLDQLHSEAHFTRRKANNARFRLLRLSEAAENLCRQAALNVRKGKEDDARELLLQKRKIMSALEKSKSRVEVLDELAAKLNEAISLKEAQLVKNVTSDFDIDEDDGEGEGEGPVRIVTPTQNDKKTLDDNYDMTSSKSDGREHENLAANIENEENVLSSSEEFLNKNSRRNEESMSSEADYEFLNKNSRRNEESMFSGPSSYIDFLEDLDQQLDKIENDLLLLANEESNESKKKKVEILKNIRETRMRIQKYVQKNSQTILF